MIATDFEQQRLQLAVDVAFISDSFPNLGAVRDFQKWLAVEYETERFKELGHYRHVEPIPGTRWHRLWVESRLVGAMADFLELLAE